MNYKFYKKFENISQKPLKTQITSLNGNRKFIKCQNI